MISVPSLYSTQGSEVALRTLRKMAACSLEIVPIHYTARLWMPMQASPPRLYLPDLLSGMKPVHKHPPSGLVLGQGYD